MTINLSDDLQAYIREKIASGQYASAGEIIETALLELKNVEMGELDAQWLKTKINVARAQVRDGDVLPFDQAMEKISRLTGVELRVDAETPVARP